MNEDFWIGLHAIYMEHNIGGIRDEVEKLRREEELQREGEDA